MSEMSAAVPQPRRFAVGDRVRSSRTGAEHTVTATCGGGTSLLLDDRFTDPADVCVLVAPHSEPAAVDGRLDALESRADRHTFTLDRLTHTIDVIGNRVAVLEAAAGEAEKPRRTTITVDSHTRFDLTYAEIGEPPPALLISRAADDDEWHVSEEIAIDPHMRAADVRDWAELLYRYTDHVAEWSRLKQASEDSEGMP